MKTIYIDSDFKCHVVDDGTMTAVETDFFDGKCDTFIEGYRFVPDGEIWTRPDGTVFNGEMIAPWKDSVLLTMLQSLYEDTVVQEDRIAALEAENMMLTECVLEISEVIYA